VKRVFRENVSVTWISLPREDFVRTRVLPQARDWSVRSISLSSTIVSWEVGGGRTQGSSFLDEGVR
jgi:hypothetical protein